jgi:hypothetical protein
MLRRALPGLLAGVVLAVPAPAQTVDEVTCYFEVMASSTG